MDWINSNYVNNKRISVLINIFIIISYIGTFYTDNDSNDMAKSKTKC